MHLLMLLKLGLLTGQQEKEPGAQLARPGLEMLSLKLFYSENREGDASFFKADFWFKFTFPTSKSKGWMATCWAKNGFCR